MFDETHVGRSFILMFLQCMMTAELYFSKERSDVTTHSLTGQSKSVVEGNQSFLVKKSVHRRINFLFLKNTYLSKLHNTQKKNVIHNNNYKKRKVFSNIGDVNNKVGVPLYESGNMCKGYMLRLWLDK